MADPITTGADWRTSAVQPSAAPARIPRVDRPAGPMSTHHAEDADHREQGEEGIGMEDETDPEERG